MLSIQEIVDKRFRPLNQVYSQLIQQGRIQDLSRIFGFYFESN